MEACTIVARNYLPYARVFAQSLTAVHPQARVTVLVIDGAADPSDAGLFRSLRLEDVIPDAAERRRQTFMYDVTELSTAVKPLLLQRLLAEGAVVGPLLRSGHPGVRLGRESLAAGEPTRGIVLTPHIAVAHPGRRLRDQRPRGVARRCLQPRIHRRRRRHRALPRMVVRPPAASLHLGSRQRRCSSISAGSTTCAGLFPHAVVRDPGCNVAYWNLHERRVARTADRLRRQRPSAALLPLQRIRSGGAVPAEQASGAQPARAAQRAAGAARVVSTATRRSLRTNGHCRRSPELRHSPRLPDGTPIDLVMRRLYRRALLDAERRGLQPPPWPFRGTTSCSG